MSVTSVTQAIQGSGQASSSGTQLAKDYESFLTLLVAQVQNQDPLAPMESTEFVSQLAQLTQVEQSVQVNSQMEALRQQLALNGALSETSLIGRDVTVPSDKIGVTESGTEFWYQLQSPAESVQAQIYDEAGNLVKVIEGLALSEGQRHHVTWDGIGEGGLQTQPGQYRLEIAATYPEGAEGGYNSYAAAEVVAVDYVDGLTYLQLADGRLVQSGEIVRAK